MKKSVLKEIAILCLFVPLSNCPSSKKIFVFWKNPLIMPPSKKNEIISRGHKKTEWGIFFETKISLGNL